MGSNLYENLAALSKQRQASGERSSISSLMGLLNEPSAPVGSRLPDDYGAANPMIPMPDPGPVPAASQSAFSPKQKASKGTTELERFVNAIAGQESNGKHSAVGVVTRNGDRAYGKYQVMGNNLAGSRKGWDYETTGKDVTPEQFLRNPQLQEDVAKGKLTEYYKKFGVAGAAKAWYGGPGAAKRNSNAKQYGGPSLNSYAQSIIRRMAGNK